MRTFFGVAEGTAYRFTLPDNIDAPLDKGDEVNVEVAYVADTQAHLLSTTEPLCQHLTQTRHIFGSLHAVQVIIGNVLWLVPMATPTTKEKVVRDVVKAQRWLLMPSQADAQAPAPPLPHASSPQARICHSSAAGLPCYESDNDGLFGYTSRVPPASGYGPLTSRMSDDSNIVANFPLYTHREVDEEKDEMEEEEEDYDDLLVPYEVPVNVAFDKPINFTRYVDVLPQGDPFPANAKLFDSRLAPNKAWTISQSMQTQFIATKLPAENRPLEWHLLTTPNLGFPGEIRDSAFHHRLSGQACKEWLGDKKHSLGPGPAVLKLVPVGSDYACQPTSATPEASYLLKYWRIVVEQDGQQCQLHQPLGEDIDWDSQPLFKHLAELASAERAPGHIIYSKAPYWYAEEVSGVGVRLRDGGSRIPLYITNDGRILFKVPGDAHLHSKRGRFDGKHNEHQRRRYYKERIVRGCMAQLRVELPAGAQHIIIKVNDTDTGDFHSLQYALRPQGSFQPIKEDEWLPLTVDQAESWVLCFFINLAKVTWGCLNRDLVRPSAVVAATAAPGSTRARSEMSATPMPKPLDPSDVVIKQETKRPRLS